MDYSAILLQWEESEWKYINGWFIGLVELSNNAFVFATNIKENDNCDGQTAANIH